ncbi:DUF2752 domain-containing protein [Muriicola sp. Z0-33]|uniref:DUF2752 domain-containing protein n=1 Tax=Muriicola sp. Z0-33 TaxID=2816957 RepID=UPI002237C67F|nr:DUF2752 domain-containing protein [Muriicola sp. Z0-33]
MALQWLEDYWKVEVRFKKSDLIYIGIGVVLLAILPLYYLYNPNVPGKFPTCPFFNFTGLYCTGCGSQRALHALLHLDILSVLKSNLLFLPALIILGYHFITKVLGRLNNTDYHSFVYHTKTPRVVFIVVVVFTVLRNIQIYPFNTLAP